MASIRCGIVFLALTSCLLNSVKAGGLLLPIQAIEDSARLSLQDFRQLYPGIPLSGQSPAERGWYVLYRHAFLMYLFGPVETRRIAEQHRVTLAAIHQQAVAQRPSLATAVIRVYHYPSEPLPVVQARPVGQTVPRQQEKATGERSLSKPKEEPHSSQSGDQASQGPEGAEPQGFNLLRWIKRLLAW